MPQQINLCTAALTPLRQRYQAKTLLSLVGGSLIVSGVLSSLWLWSLGRSAQEYRHTLDAQATEIQNLQRAIQGIRAATGPLEPALQRELQAALSAVQEREKVLQALQAGLFEGGDRHSDRLLLLSKSIPDDVWITGLRADTGAFEVSGFTLEPASLNAWVARLGQQPLLRGMPLSGVKVSLVADTASATNRPMWSFTLQSQLPLAVASAALAGAKP
jgi:Tfp pilus assembly protein PilN